MQRPYKPIESKSHRGWYEIQGFSTTLANREGKLMFTQTGHVTLGGVSGQYRRVAVKRDGADQFTLEYVHDLVCTAFWGPRPLNHVVGHGDNNKLNNRPSNLKWITQSANIKQTYTDKLRFPTYKKSLQYLYG